MVKRLQAIEAILVILTVSIVAGAIIASLTEKTQGLESLLADAEDSARQRLAESVEQTLEYELQIGRRDAQLTAAAELIDALTGDICYIEMAGTFDISYYTQGEAGVDDTTYTGAKVFEGVVAVDPALIPLGTELYVEGVGWCVALDIGGAIKGKKIDVYLDNRQEAIARGRHDARVWIKREGGLA
jgi:3D (Asp-Asp-Asp) domain-containing protein